MTHSSFCASPENLIDIPGSMQGRFIYRIVPLNRLFELFSSGRNVLVKPIKWNDPFENFILKCRLQLSDGRTASIDFQNRFYGQCWTLQSASDAMWRIYSPQANAIRLRSTIKKLASTLWRSRGKWAPNEIFIGRVRYLPAGKLERFAKGSLRSESGPIGMRRFAATLLVKRPAFRHEREVRLLFISHNKSEGIRNHFSYSTDPHEFIDQVMMDPRIPADQARTLKQTIRSRTGFAGDIKRSLLYAPPPSWTIPLLVSCVGPNGRLTIIRAALCPVQTSPLRCRSDLDSRGRGQPITRHRCIRTQIRVRR